MDSAILMRMKAAAGKWLPFFLFSISRFSCCWKSLFFSPHTRRHRRRAHRFRKGETFYHEVKLCPLQSQHNKWKNNNSRIGFGWHSERTDDGGEVLSARSVRLSANVSSRSQPSDHLSASLLTHFEGFEAQRPCTASHFPSRLIHK